MPTRGQLKMQEQQQQPALAPQLQPKLAPEIAAAPAGPPIAPNVPGNQVPSANTAAPALATGPGGGWNEAVNSAGRQRSASAGGWGTVADAAANSQQADPTISLSVGKEAAKAVETAPDKKKEEINKELENLGGEGSVEKAYRKMLKEIGGEKEFDPKLDKKDWGLFLLDFGMRMMAASGKAHSTTLGSIGEAGSGALAAMQGRQTTGQTEADEYNKQQRSEARDLADMELGEMGALADRQTDMPTTWTARGGMRPTGPGGALEPAMVDGEQIQPGQEPGSSNRAYAGQLREEALIGAGLPPDVAARVAAGAPDPAELQFEFGKAYDKLTADPGQLDVLPETNIRIKGSTKEQRQKARKDWISQRVRGIYDLDQKPALAADGTTKTGPAAEGRGRPSTFGTY